MKNSMSVGKDTWKHKCLPHHGFDTGYWRSGKMKSQLNAFNAKAGMYTLKEDDDMKAKMAAMTRRLEELELKRIHEVQAIAEAPVQVKLCPNCQSYEHWPNNNALMEILTTQVGGIIQISHGRPEHSVPTADPPSQQLQVLNKQWLISAREGTYEGRNAEETTSPPFPQALHGKKGIRNAAEILKY
ncbi:hypothetical protein CK203_065567 [Vitis vinifera]|uniref:Uncharacterized protein n=1 Tax=Vitis vinifera TaxID=29760 RepID=A0A438G6E3_VITVI|nr:hypothetical protein CK203_065567 [Vitis vinifera]